MTALSRLTDSRFCEHRLRRLSRSLHLAAFALAPFLVLLPGAEALAQGAQDFPPQVKSIVEQRCVVCHGCYDAPCQLKLDDWIGLQRGASKKKVYDGTRLLTANLTRLYEDALSTKQWRKKGFYPVLDSNPETQSVAYQMLTLKEEHPLPTSGPLPDTFDFGLEREQSCPEPGEMEVYSDQRPLQGMPFGFPGLDRDRLATMKTWLDAGAPGIAVVPAPAEELAAVARWERFLNGPSNKVRLMSRYIF